MEFLMTYGWVILVVLILIAYLSAYSFPKQNLNACIMGPGFVCKEFIFYNNGISLVLQNSLGYDIQNALLNAEFKSGGGSLCSSYNNLMGDIPDGAITRVNLSCYGATPNKKISVDITIRYKKVGGQLINNNEGVLKGQFGITSLESKNQIISTVNPTCANLIIDGSPAGTACQQGGYSLIMLPLGTAVTVTAKNDTLIKTIVFNVPPAGTTTCLIDFNNTAQNSCP